MESGSKRKKGNDDRDSQTEGADRKKLIQAEHQLGKLQSFLFELLSSLKNSADSDSLVTLVDPLVNIEIAILRKRVKELKALLDTTAATSSSSSSKKGSRFSDGVTETLPLHQELFQKQIHDKAVKSLKEKIADLEAENARLQKIAGDASIQQYQWTIDQRNNRIAVLGRELSLANATIEELRNQNEQLSQQLFATQAQLQHSNNNSNNIYNPFQPQQNDPSQQHSQVQHNFQQHYQYSGQSATAETKDGGDSPLLVTDD